MTIVKPWSLSKVPSSEFLSATKSHQRHLNLEEEDLQGLQENEGGNREPPSFSLREISWEIIGGKCGDSLHVSPPEGPKDARIFEMFFVGRLEGQNHQSPFRKYIRSVSSSQKIIWSLQVWPKIVQEVWISGSGDNMVMAWHSTKK